MDNYKVISALAGRMKMEPLDRNHNLVSFLKRIKVKEEATKIMHDWNFAMDDPIQSSCPMPECCNPN